MPHTPGPYMRCSEYAILRVNGGAEWCFTVKNADGEARLSQDHIACRVELLQSRHGERKTLKRSRRNELAMISDFALSDQQNIEQNGDAITCRKLRERLMSAAPHGLKAELLREKIYRKSMQSITENALIVVWR